MTTLVVVATASKAVFYSSEKINFEKIKLLKEFDHPENRMKKMDLIADRPGHYKTKGESRGTFEKKNPKKLEAMHFAISLVSEFDKYCKNGKYKRLILVIPASFYGVIKKHLHNLLPPVTHIDKDYTKLAKDELTSHLRAQSFVL